ncbi:GntR family transcriptional regulator [Propionivibrio dicarboxylicus]|uniref:Transcriptional regulator, GntR family n=1 Tax=Propionivibrio dicarboxylicus TaxID=83767 RepID=A0A1G8AHS7_9RHOO|nr:GntR family transcriptional regulator [Propionivibrio dicarboxylicus]SDH20508.1 transcriptional regulator, GntR family [Propionivibrio dicarboxylicus]
MTSASQSLAQTFPLQKQVSLGNKFRQFLRAAIVRAELLPGQLISEIEMSKRFAIGRQPVREAFISLAQEHLVDVRPSRGTYVRMISMNEVIDAWHVREPIEVSIVRQVAKKHEAATMAALRRLVAEQRTIAPGDNEAFLAADQDFHHALAAAANREFAWRVIDSAKAQMDRVCFLSYALDSPVQDLIGDHDLMLDAIEAGDAKAAVQVMEGHLAKIVTAAQRVAEHYPDYFIDESPREW